MADQEPGRPLPRAVVAPTYRFGPFRFDRRERVLYEDGKEVELQLRAVRVLEHLLQRPGQIISKDELLDLWGGTAVTEHSLSESIRIIRSALHDSATEPTYIQTLRKRGFRFIAEVEAEAPILTSEKFHDSSSILESVSAGDPGIAPPIQSPVSDARLGPRWSWLLPTVALVGVLGAGAVWYSTNRAIQRDQEALSDEFDSQRRENEDRFGALARQLAGAASRIEVWAGDGQGGGPTPDGRHVVHRTLSGGLAMRDLATGDTVELIAGSDDRGTVPGWSVAESVVSPDGRRVAYLWENWADGGVELRLVGTDGSDPSSLYRDADSEYFALEAWSADGSTILVRADRNDGSRDIVLVDAPSGSPRVLRSFARELRLGDLDLSPDGRRIVYDRQSEAGSSARDLYLIASAGGDEIPLHRHPANDHSPQWVPDGSGVFFLSDRTGITEGWLLSTEPGQPSSAAGISVENLGNVLLMGFSRDGTLFYWQRKYANNIFVGQMDFETGELLVPLEQVSFGLSGTNIGPAWSLDQGSLAWISNAHDVPMLLAVRDLESGQTKIVETGLDRYMRSLRWTPDGRVGAMGRGTSGPWGIWTMDPATGAITDVLVGTSSGGSTLFSPLFSPDGQRLYYSRRGSDALFSRDLATGVEFEVLNLGEGEGTFFYPQLSHDGEQVGMAIRAPESWVLAAVPATGGTPRPLAERPLSQGVMQPWDWTPDGRFLVYQVHDESDRGYWRIPVEGGEPVRLELPATGGYQLRIAPDGKTFAIQAGGEATRQSVWTLEDFLPPER